MTNGVLTNVAQLPRSLPLPVPQSGNAPNTQTVAGARDAQLDPKLVTAAHEFEASMMAELLKPLNIPVVRMNRFDDLLGDPHLAAVGLFQRHEHPEAGPYVLMRPPVKYSATPANIRRHPPRLGQHTAEVFGELADGPGDALPPRPPPAPPATAGG